MTDVNENDSSQIETVESLDIASLRRFAKLMGVQAERGWSKEDFVNAIKSKQASTNTMLVLDNSKAPKPGYARIIIHRDPSPGTKNLPVHTAINGRIFAIPRGLEIDVPEPIVEVLANARTIDTSQQAEASARNPGGEFKDIERLSYPFQVLAITPGKFDNQADGRSVNYALRKEFHTKHGTWPTHAELTEFRKAKINERI